MDPHGGWETPFHLTACPVHHECHEGIECIASPVMKLVSNESSRTVKDNGDLRRDQTDNAAPAKSDPQKVEKGHVQTICSSLDFGQDLAIVL